MFCKPSQAWGLKPPQTFTLPLENTIPLIYGDTFCSFFLFRIWKHQRLRVLLAWICPKEIDGGRMSCLHGWEAPRYELAYFAVYSAGVQIWDLIEQPLLLCTRQIHPCFTTDVYKILYNNIHTTIWSSLTFTRKIINKL